MTPLDGKDWQITTLYSALENWGRHFEWCDLSPCNCGYLAALKRPSFMTKEWCVAAAELEGQVVATTWSERLWKEAERLAAELDGADVVRHLAKASADVWDAGLDHAYKDIPFNPTDAGAFDVTWLSLFIVSLSAHRSRERTE